MKRFTGTEKWDDPWFQDLTPELKLLWLYICDSCDCAGIWKMNQKLVNFRLGLSVDLDQARNQFGKRIHKIEPDKWFIIPFIRFQYGVLNSDCRPHKPVLSLVELHDLNRVLEGYWKGINTLQEQDKEQDKEKDKDRGNAKGGKVAERVRVYVAMQKDGFPEAWNDWMEYKSGDVIHSATFASGLLKCERWGPRKAVAIIRLAIFKGWKSLIDPDNSSELESFMPGSEDNGKPDATEELAATKRLAQTVNEGRMSMGQISVEMREILMPYLTEEAKRR